MKILFICFTDSDNKYELMRQSVEKLYKDCRFLKVYGGWDVKENELNMIEIFDKEDLMYVPVCRKAYLGKFLLFKYLNKLININNYDYFVLLDDDIYFIDYINFSDYKIAGVLDPFTRFYNYVEEYKEYFRDNYKGTINSGFLVFNKEYLIKLIDFTYEVMEKIIKPNFLKILNVFDKNLTDQFWFNLFLYKYFEDFSDLNDHIYLCLESFRYDYSISLIKKYKALHYIYDKDKWYFFLKVFSKEKVLFINYFNENNEDYTGVLKTFALDNIDVLNDNGRNIFYFQLNEFNSNSIKALENDPSLTPFNIKIKNHLDINDLILFLEEYIFKKYNYIILDGKKGIGKTTILNFLRNKNIMIHELSTPKYDFNRMNNLTYILFPQLLKSTNSKKIILYDRGPLTEEVYNNKDLTEYVKELLSIQDLSYIILYSTNISDDDLKYFKVYTKYSNFNNLYFLKFKKL